MDIGDDVVNCPDAAVAGADSDDGWDYGTATGCLDPIEQD